MNPHSLLHRNIVDIIPQMSFTLSLYPQKRYKAGEISSCNALAQQFIGYTENEIKRKGFRFFLEIIHPDDIHQLVEASQLLTQGKQTKYEAKYRVRSKKQKDFITIRVSSTISYKDKRGKEMHTLNIIHMLGDTTESSETINKRNSKIIKNRLTQRNIEFARLIGAGKTVKETARLLHVSIPTVKWQRSEIRKKLEIDNNAKLLIFLNEADL